ncbi:MAG TPA: GNAT family protein [Actinomycetota bacterium]
MVELRGRRVVLRAVDPEDVDRLWSILREPAVAERWGPFGRAEIESDLVGSDEAFAIEVEGEIVGAIQFGEEEDPMYRHASVDVFLTTSRHGQRLGREAVYTLVRHLIDDRGHHRITIDPAADNRAAIRAYERVGFRPVGVLRRYERGADGTWHDGLLMELVAEELVDPGA